MSRAHICTTALEELVFWIVYFELPTRLVTFLMGFFTDPDYKVNFLNAHHHYVLIYGHNSCFNDKEICMHFYFYAFYLSYLLYSKVEEKWVCTLVFESYVNLSVITIGKESFHSVQ